MKFLREQSQEEQAQLLRALKEWGDPSEVRGACAVGLSCKGWTVPQIAEALDSTRWSVRHWIDLYMDKKTGATVSAGHMSRLPTGPRLPGRNSPGTLLGALPPWRACRSPGGCAARGP